MANSVAITTPRLRAGLNLLRLIAQQQAQAQGVDEPARQNHANNISISCGSNRLSLGSSSLPPSSTGTSAAPSNASASQPSGSCWHLALQPGRFGQRFAAILQQAFRVRSQ
jgi:hypothetical protein